jgi:hypothetical protein
VLLVEEALAFEEGDVDTEGVGPDEGAADRVEVALRDTEKEAEGDEVPRALAVEVLVALALGDCEGLFVAERDEEAERELT